MESQQEQRTETPSPWARAFNVFLGVGVVSYGVFCAIRGRLVSEGTVPEGTPARIVGAVVAGLGGGRAASKAYSS
jgi:hypothetical protein